MTFQYLKLLISLLLFSFNTQALTPAVEALVNFETKANAAAERDSARVLLPHVEIPIEDVGLDFSKTLDPMIEKSLLFEKNGQTYVRWILNPEDTKWGKELLQYFAKRKRALKINYYFYGYKTASRSYIAEDPRTGAQFSVKSSTNVTGGAWKDKKQPVGEALDGRLLSDFLQEQNRKRAFENFEVMYEPAVLTLEAIDQAVVIRDLGAIKNSGRRRFYVPGFSVLHEKVGADIALRNGSTDPYKFWTEHYIKVAGRALGELAARTGIQFDSPHSQNFLVELDSNHRPTGKLILRDMSDLYIDATYMNALLGENNKILKKFSQKSNIHNYISAGFGPLHGNSFPSWIHKLEYEPWMDVFFNEFDRTFEKISGYDISGHTPKRSMSGKYFLKSYSVAQKEEYKSLLMMMKREGVVRNYRCQILFQVP